MKTFNRLFYIRLLWSTTLLLLLSTRLHIVYADKSIQVLLNQFINAKMDKKESIANHISKIVSLTQQLKTKTMNMEQENHCKNFIKFNNNNVRILYHGTNY